MVCGALACVAAATVFLAGFSMDVLVGTGKYTQSEGDWAKAQKEAIIRLERYGKSGSEADFQAYRDSLRLPLAFQEIRQQITGSKHDRAARERALAATGIPVDNWPRMVRRHRVFGRQSQVAQAVRWWGEGDRGLAELQMLGDRLHSQVSAPARNDAAIEQTF